MPFVKAKPQWDNIQDILEQGENQQDILPGVTLALSRMLGYDPINQIWNSVFSTQDGILATIPYYGETLVVSLNTRVIPTSVGVVVAAENKRRVRVDLINSGATTCYLSFGDEALDKDTGYPFVSLAKYEILGFTKRIAAATTSGSTTVGVIEYAVREG